MHNCWALIAGRILLDGQRASSTSGGLCGRTGCLGLVEYSIGDWNSMGLLSRSVWCAGIITSWNQLKCWPC